MQAKHLLHIFLVFALIVCVQSQNSTLIEYDETARRRRKTNKYTLPILIGTFMAKSLIIPLVFKVLAFMTGGSIFLSFLSLIMSSVVAYLKSAEEKTHLKVVHKIPTNWAKDDANYYENMIDNAQEPTQHFLYKIIPRQ